MKMKYLLLLLLPLMAACRKERKVNTSFYYWKTIYKNDPKEQASLKYFGSKSLYVRLMDVDRDVADGRPVPVSPITFKDNLPAGVGVITVVFMVNDVLKGLDSLQLTDLASRIAKFVPDKVAQSGSLSFSELQIDCDWTAGTRQNYFLLLNALKKRPELKGKIISATLRLHQLKNIKSAGIPPVDKVMLMCYNMGNLRKFGQQNSIIELAELKKYLSDNLTRYPLPADVGLPLFSWAVVFRNGNYIGLSKRMALDTLKDPAKFRRQNDALFVAVADLPSFGIQANDMVRWEQSDPETLSDVAKYISKHLPADTVNIAYFHLDKTLLKQYPNATLEKISNLFR